MSTEQLQRIIVGYGGDRKSRDALALGAALATAADAELHIALIIKTDDPFVQAYPPVGNVTGILAEQGSTWLEQAQATLPDGVRSKTHLRAHYSVAEGLLGLAEEVSADLIVTGSGIGTGRRNLHPVVNALLHSSPVPVALAPQDYRVTEGITHILAAIASEHAFHQVVERSVSWAVQLSLPLALTTLRSEEKADEGWPVPQTEQLDASASSLEQLEKTLADRCTLAPRLTGYGKSMKKTVGSIPWPAGGVLMIGSSRLARKQRIFLGVTAARLLAHLPIPMVVLPRVEDPANHQGTI